jgi:hypothetical protein
LESLAELKKKRTQFMHAVYEMTEGNELKSINMWQLGEKLGFGQRSELTFKIYQYLIGEGLIKGTGMGGEMGITHRGIKEVEAALENPQQSTEHFAPLATVNIIHVNSMVNSQIQQSVAGSTQTATIDATQVATLKEIIAELKDIVDREKLTVDQQEDLEKEKAVLALEANSSKPNKNRIKESLSTAQKILTVASVGLAVATKIGALLAGF